MLGMTGLAINNKMMSHKLNKAVIKVKNWGQFVETTYKGNQLVIEDMTVLNVRSVFIW